MSMSRSAVSESQQRLMIAIGTAIQHHTMISPMTLEDIVGVLAFTTGAAIARTDRRMKKSELRQMAVANIDNGIQAITANPSPAAGSNIILPN